MEPEPAPPPRPPAQLPEERAQMLHQARRTAILSIAINGMLSVIKAAAGFFGNSYVLIADAIESLSDVLSSLVVWLGLSVASLPPTERHPYGKGRAETIAGAFVSLLLLVAAILIAKESIHEIRTPHMLPAPFTLGVLVGVVFVKEALFRWMHRNAKETLSSALTADAWHHRSDAITSLLAFIGISVALIGGPGHEAADDWAALAAAALIAAQALRLLYRTSRELLDAAPDPSVIDDIRRTAEATTGVLGTHRCVVRKVGIDLFVELDVLVDGEKTVTEGHAIAHHVREQVMSAVPGITSVLVHIEPFSAGKEPTSLRFSN